jgi:hypothetical protein
MEADLGKLYSKPVGWDKFNNAISLIYTSDSISQGCPLPEDKAVKLNAQEICAKLASLGKNCKPNVFAASITERAHLSHAMMAIGSMTVDDHSCEFFDTTATALLATAFATIGAASTGKLKGVNAEHLPKVWCIPHDDAARTLMVTTQSLRHNPDLSLSRNVGANDQAVRYRKIKSYFFSDTLFVMGPARSLQGNICAQLFVSNKGFVALYPMKRQQDYFLALKQFAKDVGAPDVLVCDPHPAQTKWVVREFCTQIGTTMKVLKAETHWGNHAEL